MRHRDSKNVFVGLSGGVDSAVAAMLLLKDGWDVTGVFMKNYTAEIVVKGIRQPCWLQEWRDATRVAAHLKIPLITFDFEEIYRRDVLEYVYREYNSGRTPNPDVLCNSQIKFGSFMYECTKRGADFVATGHYARVEHSPNVRLLFAVDTLKDQTYFLHGIAQDSLARALFPIGSLRKNQVREIAKQAGLHIAEKKDSTGICFVGEVQIKDFLKDRVETASGEIITTDGNVIGRHDGLAWYTIGQRHGFSGKGFGEPLFIVKKDTKSNQLIVGRGTDPALYKSEITIENPHWINEPTASAPNLFCRFRHRQPLQSINSLTKISQNQWRIETKESQRAITPGQFAVIYDNEECFGGGVIV